MNKLILNGFRVAAAVLAATNIAAAIAQFNVSANSELKLNDPERSMIDLLDTCKSSRTREYYISASKDPSAIEVLVKAPTLIPGEVVGQQAAYIYRSIKPLKITPCP